MAATTQGYDVLIELSHSFLNRIAGALFKAGVIPDHWEPAGGQKLPLDGFAVYLGLPSVKLESRPGAPAWLRFGQEYTVRAADWPGEIVGRWSVPLPIEIATREVDGVPVQMLRCDCSKVDIDDIDVDIEKLGAILGLFVLAEVHKIVTARIVEIPLSAPLPGAPIRLSVNRHADQDFLTVWATLDGRAGPFVGPPKAFVPSGGFDKKPDAAVAIDQGVYLPPLKQALADAGLVKGRKFGGIDKVVHDGVFKDSVLRSITLTKNVKVDVIEGSIKVSGAVDADISAMPDASADFTLWLGLSLAGGKVAVTVVDSDIDIDSVVAAILSTVLFGPIGLVVEQVAENAVGAAIENALQGQGVSADLPIQTMFVSGVEVTNAATSDKKTAVLVTPTRVRVKSDHLLFDVQFEFQYEPVERTWPPYYRAHTVNREFHLTGCEYGDRIKPKTLETFIRPQEALAKGYDGCRKCLPQYNGMGTGELTVAYERPSGGVAVKPAPAAVTATYLGASPLTQFAGPVERAGGTGPAGEDGLWRDAVSLEPLAPGKWAVTVAEAGWAKTRKVTVKGGARITAKFKFSE